MESILFNIHLMFQINYLGGKQLLTMQQINTAMLTKLKFTAETALKTKVVDCVLNVSLMYPPQHLVAL